MLKDENDKFTGVFNAWKRYIDTGLGASKFVDSIIADSWIRCRKIGLNPYKSKLRIEDGDILKAKKESARVFIDTIIPYISGLKANSPHMNILMGLFSCEGVLMYIDGDKSVLDIVLGLGIKEGADFSEESAGTNAIAIAMQQKASVAVCGFEHFCQDLHIFNTASTPIFNSKGKAEVVLGMIALGAGSNMFHLKTLLTSTVFFMEREMRLKRIQPRLGAYTQLIKRIFEEAHDALLIMTRHGYIKQINLQALKMFDIDNYAQLNEPFENLLKIEPSLVKLLEVGKKIPEEMLFSINTSTHSFKATVYLEPLLSNMNEPIGMLARFHKVSNKGKVIKKANQVKYRFEDIVGKNPAIQKAIAIAKKAAKTSINVLIEGKSGTGKEMFAQSIHNAGERTDRPFIVVDCASVPKDLIESELFGYEEGAFTGAKKEGAQGKFEAADGGTILLNEIGDMPLELQSRLLRVLENRTITRVGSNKEIPIDIRVIADTNKNLIEMIEKEEFRDDLYYRLSVTQIKIPSLKERPEDIALLLNLFISHLNETMGGKINGIEPALMERLLLYSWPGNAREVRNMVEHAFGVEKEGFISWQHLSDNLRETLLYSPSKISHAKQRDPLSKEREKVLASEKEMYMSAIKIVCRNMSKTASVLGVSRATLYRKLTRLGIKK